MYIHERTDWPNFTWDQKKVADLLVEARYLQGRLLGRMEALGFQVQEEAALRILTQDVVKTSEIEGEKLNIEQVRSSIAKRMGMDIGATLPTDRHVEGVVEMMLDATRHYDALLTQDRLFRWHTLLFPADKSSFRRMVVGGWRTEASGPMQVVSGPYGREKVHYEAPAYDRLEKEMSCFIDWFNGVTEIDLVIKSALAHFWFVTIHPFDDGNGRIARAIADMTLAHSEKSPQRFYSMSAQIQRERNDYYDVLERCQKGSLDITVWMEWYLTCLKHAIVASQELLQVVLMKAQFWAAHTAESFNERQRLIINRLLDNNFEGKLNSSKWSKLTKCSQDTALRDINDLLERGVLVKEEGGGRSTSYWLRAV
ncbi:MAG: Fic family protein [Gammaproteobacteria bacterium]|nr:MAG: Fic family protein [Gammaproteobacteria bacterium]